MKSFQILSFLILINLFNLYICADVTLTAIKKGNDLDLNCEYKSEDVNETLSHLEVLKDDVLIISYDSTSKKHNITGVHGASDITDISEGHNNFNFKIVKTNNETVGTYKCIVTTNKKVSATSNPVDLTKFDIKITDSKASITIMTMNNLYMVTCNTAPKFNDKNSTDKQLVKLTIFKAKYPVLALTGKNLLEPDHSDFNPIIHHAEEPSLTFHMNKTDKAYGKYSCQILFRSGTDKYETMVETNEYDFKASSANSYLSDKLMVFLSTFLLIFVSFK